MSKTGEMAKALILLLTLVLSCDSYTGVISRSKSCWPFLKGTSRAAVASSPDDFTPLISVGIGNNVEKSFPLFDRFPGDEGIAVKVDSNGTRQFVSNHFIDDSNETRAKYLLGKKKLKAKLDAIMDTNQAEAIRLFEEYSLHTASEKAEILQRNDQFFQALKSNDMTLLTSLWLNSEDCLCRLGSRKELINGYRNIIAYLSAVNLRKEPAEVVRVSLKFMGDMAVVSSEVRSFSGHSPSPEKGVVGYVTNVFVKSPDAERYQLLTHLASLKEPVLSPHHSVFQDPTVLPPDPRKRKLSLSPMQGLLRRLNQDDGDDAHADESDHMDGDDEYDDDMLFTNELTAEEYSDEEDDTQAMMRMVPRQGGIVFVTPVDGDPAAAGSALEHIREAMKASLRGRPGSDKGRTRSLQQPQSSSSAHLRRSVSGQRDEGHHGVDAKRDQRRPRDSMSTEEADGDYDEEYEDDLLDEDEEDAALDQERRLVSFACESMVGWLEARYGTDEHDRHRFEVSLSPRQALALRTVLIDSLMKNQPSTIEAAFCMFLCRQAPRYLGGDFLFDMASLPHSSSHFEQLSGTEDMADLVRLWKQYAARLVKQERGGHAETHVSHDAAHLADNGDDSAVDPSHPLSTIDEGSAKRLPKELSDVQGLIQVDAGLFQQLVQVQSQHRRSVTMRNRRGTARKQRASLSRPSHPSQPSPQSSSQRSSRRRPSRRNRGGDLNDKAT